MKKLSTLLLALVATTALWAQNFEVNSIFYSLLGGDSVEVIGKLLQSSDTIIIPSTITYQSTAYRVTSIGDYAFRGTSIASVTISNSVTRIGRYVFSECDSLSSITLPDNVTSIGDHAFNHCHSLKSVNIPNSVTSIGKYAFNECTSLSSITIPNGVISIGHEAFYRCNSLTSITIPNSVTSIGGVAFIGCTSLTSIDVDPANTHYESVDGVLFNYAKDTLIQYPVGSTRTMYAIPNSVTCIIEGAFCLSASIQSVTIPSSVTDIESAFYNCTSLSSITCFATNPPICDDYCFGNVDKSIPLYVPTDSISAYQAANEWKDFTNIQAIASEEVTEPVTSVTTTSTNNSVTITWPTDANAGSYTIEIKKDDVVFCTLTFNAQGQLTNIAFAPGRGSSNDAVMAEEVAGGYKFTITSLTPGTKYTYEVDTKNASGTSIANYTGTFTTTGSTTGLDQLIDSGFKIQNSKYIRNGQLLIIRDGKVFNAMGVRL